MYFTLIELFTSQTLYEHSFFNQISKLYLTHQVGTKSGIIDDYNWSHMYILLTKMQVHHHGEGSAGPPHGERKKKKRGEEKS